MPNTNLKITYFDVCFLAPGEAEIKAKYKLSYDHKVGLKTLLNDMIEKLQEEMNYE